MKIPFFIKPTWIKLFFMVYWAACVIVAIPVAGFKIRPIAFNLIWPFLFFYIVGCGFVAFSKNSMQSWGWRRYASVIMALTAVDHVLKYIVFVLMPVGGTIPVVPYRFHVAHFQNIKGSWLAAATASEPVVGETLMICLVFLVLAPWIYRFYIRKQRISFWVRSGFVLMMSGLASCAVDLAIRGMVIDYLYLPGLYAADLKDILLVVGATALVVEMVDNPQVVWKGWRAELMAIPNIFVRIWQSTAGYLRGRR
jgi:lipoprotein signal peptidase